MSKKKLYLIALVLFVGLGLYLVSETLELVKYKKVLKANSELPTAGFISLEKEPFNTSSISSARTCIIFFSTGCPHCKSEFEALEKNSEVMDSITFILVGKESIEKLKEFSSTYNQVLLKAKLYSDQNNEFLKKFGSSVVPNSFLYHKRRLIKNIKGAFDVTKLVNVFRGKETKK